MNRLKFKIITIVLILVQLSGCASKKNSSTSEGFEFINGNEKITFEILTGNKYLEINNTTKTKFTFENIDPNKIIFIGKTIKVINGNAENELLVEMTPKKEDLEDGKLIIFVTYKNLDGVKNYRLKIPVKL